MSRDALMPESYKRKADSKTESAQVADPADAGHAFPYWRASLIEVPITSPETTTSTRRFC